MKKLFLVTFLLTIYFQRTMAESHESHATSAHPFVENHPRMVLNLHEPIDHIKVGALKKELCLRDFNRSHWVQKLPIINGTFSQTEAVSYLLMFQKKGGFEVLDASDHYSILRAILQEPNFVKDQILLVDQALESIHASYPVMYQQFLTEFPSLLTHDLRIARLPNPKAQCRSLSEEEYFKAKAVEALEQTQANAGTDPDLKTWRKLLPLRTSLNALTAERKEENLHDMILRSTRGLSESPELSGIFDSKLAHMTLQSLFPIFGLKSRELTDLDVESKGGAARVRLLGIHPLTEGQTENRFGFFSKELVGIHFTHSSIIEKEYEWKQLEQPYKGRVRAVASSKTLSRKGESSLPFNEIWRDGKLHGMVLVGTNQAHEALTLLEQYKTFYQGHGYTFGDSLEETQDLYEHFKTAVSSGDVDYFIKEAHSDSDSLNLFQLPSKGRLLRGKKILPDGKTEEITLAYPAPSSSGKLISNQAFGEWVRMREGAGKGTIVYINASCWSANNKACNELAAAGSNSLIVLPTVTTADPLENKPDNALYQLVEGILEKKNYEEIREKMKRDPYYADHKWDWYIFPDEKEYEDRIWRNLKVPIDIEVAITDGTGKPYRLIEAR